MQQVLVVANQTAVGSHITQRLHELKNESGEIAVHVLVPATRTSRLDVDSEGRPIHDADGVERAKQQVARAVEAIEKIGAVVTGGVGTSDPMAATLAATRERRIDRVIVSTLPVGASRWLAMDLPHRLQRRLNVPVEHIVGKDVPDVVRRGPVGRPIKVLLVEDQPADIALARRAIDSVDVETELMVAKNGAEALAAVRTYHTSGFDLLLLDLKMPVLDGHEFLEQAGKEVDLDELSIVVLTTSTNDADRERAHALGAAAYMVKDPDYDRFAESLGSVIREIAAG